MTVEEKRKLMMEHCNRTDSCALDNCPLWHDKTVVECDLEDDDFVNKYYDKLFSNGDDKVDHPSHYNQGGIECIDAMISAFGKEAVKDFCVLNAFKYVWRSVHKNGIEDIEKATWYLNKMKELHYERREESL